MRNRSRPSAGWFVVLTGAAALLSACGGGDSPDHALRTRFPAQAAQILEGAASPAPDDDGYRLNAITTTNATEEARRAPGITARFPRNGAQPVRFDLPSGASFHVREPGVHGPAEEAGAAIAYARDGGTAFWTRTASGYEEWLLLDAGIACPGAEVAAWEVEGGSLRQRGDAIEVLDAEGRAQIRVTAPKAFAAGGREVPVRISAGGQRIAIEVDAGCEAALVDPAWELVKPMLTERYEHATVRLGDAMNEIVLVIGGTLSNGLVTDGVEAYDPKSDLWSARASLLNPRTRHTATVLKDGKVLVAGGFTGGSNVPWVEIYDPVINVWTAGPSMKVGRHSHAAALLNDGRVLVAGGLGVLGFPLKDAEIYDPAANTWSNIAPMTTERFLHTATTLLDGRVLVWGAAGLPGFSTLNTPFDVFDPAAGTWMEGDLLEPTRQRHTATLLPNGNVLIVGGEIKGEPLASVQIFEPMGNLRNYTTPLLTPRSMHTATLLPNGNVLVAGGYTLNGAGVSPTATTEIFYPSNVRWSYSASLNDARDSHTATLLHDTRVLVAGGKGFAAIDSAEVYGAALGDSCQTVKDCPSGHCVDGTCCDAACDLGQCDACSTMDGASQNGHCEILTGAFCDDGQACTAEDKCDASGVCLSGPVIACTPSSECLEAACDFGLGACVETPTDDGAYCSVGSCKAGVCVEPPGTGGAGGSGGVGGSGGTGGSGGAPAALEEIYVQGGCICGVTGLRAPIRKPSWTLGLLTAALGMLAARRAPGRRA